MKDFKKLINLSNPVNHVAIIMDGNGRWASRKGLPRIEGHKVGSQIVEPVIEAAKDIGIKALTLYTFSTENWSRPAQEVKGLWNIIETFVVSKFDDINKNDVRVIVSGALQGLPRGTGNILKEFIEATKNNKSITVNICLNYGGRQEIVNAVNTWLDKRKQGEKINEAKLAKYLYTAALPEVDLMIRTGGDCRISNFLLWQLAYAELAFADVLWPDFRPKHLYKAVYEFQNRERRFGGL